MKYYIYHLPNFVYRDGSVGKIGCTHRLIQRKCTHKGRGHEGLQVLEVHEDVMIASAREQELQGDYGYKVDRIPYYKSAAIGSTRGKKGGQKNAESGHIRELGRATGHKHVESGHLARVGREANVNKRQPINAYIYATGKCVGTFESQTDAAKQLGLYQGSIYNVLKGIAKRHGIYTFTYATDPSASP